MSDPFADVVRRMQAALLGEAEKMGRMPVIVAVLSRDILESYWNNYPKLGVRLEAFEGRSDALVQHGPCGDVLWLDPALSGYREVFGRFLKASWNCQATLTRSGYDVDHVYNRARALRQGYPFVRMFLVRAAANQDHGRNFEKQIGVADAMRQPKIMKLLDGMSELKVLGLPPVRNGLLTQEHYAAAQLAATTYGFPLDEAVQTLRNIFARAHPEE